MLVWFGGEKDTLTASELQTKFGIESLRFEDTPGALTRAIISGPRAEGAVYLHGAHITSWTPRGQRPVLFTSSKSKYEPGAPIRGGVPIIFPWFGPRSDGKPGPMHGFARTVEWTVDHAVQRPDGAIELGFSLEPNDLSRANGYDAFRLRFRVAFGAALEMELEVHNRSTAPLPIEEALHTYYAVGDIHKVSVTGLDGTTYVDKTAAGARKQTQGPILIARETDQVHLNTASPCEIHDNAWNRTIVIEKSGSQSTVVWNPWIEKTRSLADMAPDDWQSMICVETVNALDNALVVPPDGIHRLGATIRIS